MAPSAVGPGLQAGTPKPTARGEAAIRTLVAEMATANPVWDAPRIHGGELDRLGIEVAERTVSRLL